ncbi:MAG TPA: ABC transporter transmembrane domain-containing protein [Pseudonocardiaceae bacterium]|nr:ABC transporter transmembrane domain-containing protein [Pseudonocardiaceae bacterium]
MTANQVLAPYVKRHRGALVGAGVATIVLTAASLVSPWPLKFVIDQLVTRQRPFHLDSGDFMLLGGVVALIILVAGVSALADYWSEVWLYRSGEQIVHDLRVALYAHLQRLSLAFHDTQKTGNLVTRLTGDVNSVGELFSESLGEIVSAVLLLVGMATVSVIVDPILALAVLGVTPILFVVTSRYKRRLKDLARRQRAEEGEIASLANESLSAMQVVKAFGSERFERNRVARRSRSRLAIGVLLSRTEARFSGLIDMLGAVAMALVVILGVFRVATGHLSPGDLVVFTSYASKTYKPLKDIARQLGKVQQSMARADRVAEILAADTVLEERRGTFGGRARGEVELTNVSFSYPTGRPVLHDVSVRIRPGSRIAIVGSSGAGKSTLAALVARFYDPTSGQVSIDGRDVRDWSLRWLREQVGLLLQDTVLFSGTVAANIAYASDAPFARVVSAARTAGARDFITQLPAGYGTELGQRGVGLSGGQRQRIGIARVLLRDPPILILDEPTTGLDTATEAELMDGLQVLMRGRTTIIITHSIALARTADRVLVLEKGRVVEDGSPDDLLARRGAFHRLAHRPTKPGPDSTGGGRRTPPPPDPALPEMAPLLDVEAMRPVLRRSLRAELADAPLDDLRIARVRYKPRDRVTVHYRTTIARRDHHAVATVIAGRDLRTKVHSARHATMDGRCPGARPVFHDPASNAVITWCPFDAKLPGLAASPAELANRLADAGVPVRTHPGEPVVLGYKPGSRAVLRFGDHILKAYARDSQFDAAVTGLLASGRAPSLPTSRLSAAFGDLRLTAQPALDGSPPADAADVAHDAGAFLRTLHACESDDLAPAPPARQLSEAKRQAELTGVLVPDLAPLLRWLTDRLARLLPADPDLLPAHGDFHVDQLIVSDGRFAVVDFDDMCLAPAALDAATYAADVVRGRDDDVERVFAVLDPLCDGYRSTPDHIEWYLSTAILCRMTHPFRAQAPNWPERVRAMVRAASEVLR